MTQTLWLFFGPRRVEDQRSTRKWSLLVSEDQFGMTGTRLSLIASMGGLMDFKARATEGYDLNNIPPGDEGVSGRILLGQLAGQLSNQALLEEIEAFDGSLVTKSIASESQKWCLIVVRHLEAQGIIRAGAVANLFSHAWAKEAISVSKQITSLNGTERNTSPAPSAREPSAFSGQP
jgi:hypothetical protein